MNRAGGPAGAVRRTVTIRNRRGLHARAAARFAKRAEAFDAQVRVSFRGQTVSALSIMGLMMLAAGPGSDVELAAEGPQAAAALAALASLVDNRFEEDS
jgi:phosphocarrier protein